MHLLNSAPSIGARIAPGRKRLIACLFIRLCLVFAFCFVYRWYSVVRSKGTPFCEKGSSTSVYSACHSRISEHTQSWGYRPLPTKFCRRCRARTAGLGIGAVGSAVIAPHRDALTLFVAMPRSWQHFRTCDTHPEVRHAGDTLYWRIYRCFLRSGRWLLLRTSAMAGLCSDAPKCRDTKKKNQRKSNNFLLDHFYLWFCSQ